MHPERENPGHAYEKRAPALRWDGAPEWLIRPWPTLSYLLQRAVSNVDAYITRVLKRYLATVSVRYTDLHIYNLDAVPSVHVVSNHVDTDKLITANSGTFTSSSASHNSQSR